MAGRGPPPKDPRRRVGRRAPARGEWVTLPEGRYRGKRPHLPRIKGGLLASTKEAWAEWWASPVANMWTTADWSRLRRLLLLTDEVTRRALAGESRSSLAAEVRLLEDSLGLSSKGRRDLRWRLPEEAPQRGELATVAELRPSRGRQDPRTGGR